MVTKQPFRFYRVAACVFCLFGSRATYGADQTPGYLLITSEGLAPQFQSLVNRRTALGKPAELHTTQWIYANYNGADNQAKIRECIKDHYLNHGTLWAALGGDEIVVPVRTCRPVPTEPGTVVPADLYYSDMDGGNWDANGNGIYGEVGDVAERDLTPEVYIGRIPVWNAQQVTDYINKVIAYENASPDGFARSMLYLCADTPIYSGETRPLDYRQHDPVGNGDFGYTIWYWEKIQPYWQAFPMHGLFATHTSWDESDWGDYDLTSEHLTDQLNQGHHFVTFSGEANAYTWWLEKGSAFTATDASNLTNPLPFIIHSGGCEPAWFDKAGDCLGEAFLHNPTGGAVVFFGYARGIGWAPLSHHDVLFEEMFKNGYRNVGEAFAKCKLAGAPLCVSAPYSQLIYTLLGDPGLEMHWDEAGRHLQVYIPSGMEVYDLNADITIRWNAAGAGFAAGEQVRLDYSSDSGTSWQTIPGAEQLAHTSSPFVWTHPSLPEGTHYRVRVVSLADPNVDSGSRKNFAVHPLGLLAVRSTPAHRDVSIQGSQPNSTPYTFTVMLNSVVALTAPEKGGFFSSLDFVDWIDAAGTVLTTTRTLSFTFTQNVTVTARYEYRGPTTHYFVNDEVPEPGFAAGDDSHDGLSGETPMRHIQSLLTQYHSLGWGAVVHVSDGTYVENINIAPDHTLGTDIDHSGMTLSGAGAGRSVIDGAASGSCLKAVGTSQVHIDGFTIRNGSADLGGGLNLLDTTASLTNCTLERNSADLGGGLNLLDTTASLTNCTLEHNTANKGGALFANGDSLRMNGCIIQQNVANLYGGGAYLYHLDDATIEQCVLQANSAAYGGGALFDDFCTAFTLVDSRIDGNRAQDGAGAVCRSSASLRCVRNRFVGNMAERHGGALYIEGNDDVVITNSLLADGAALYGAGVYSYHSALQVGHCTFYENAAIGGGGAVYSVGQPPSLANSIFWNDEPQELSFEIGTPLLAYCDIKGGWSGTGNIAVDPLFRSPAGLDGDPNTLADNDYHIRFQSPCRNAGDPDFVPADQERDIDGQPRVMCARVDIGADEAPIPGDSDYDNDVDESDFDRFELCASGPTITMAPGCEWAEFDYDHDVDQCDFGIFQRCYSGDGNPSDPNCAQ